MNWTQVVQPSYTYVLPELILVAVLLIVMVLDLYVTEKRVLVWTTLSGIVLAMVAVWFGSTDQGISAAIANGAPQEFFGKMLVADNFSFFLRMVLLGAVALVVLQSIDYVEKFLRGLYIEFYEVLLVATVGMMMMVSSRDLITIYVGLELASISSYILAGLLRHDAKSNEAALKYFLNGALASAVLLFGLSILYGIAGSTYLPDIAGALGTFAQQAADSPGSISMAVTGILFLAGGFAFKVAAVPMHLWTPDVYEGAPTPVTGFFSVGPKGAAFGAILRIFVVGMGVAPFAQRWSLAWAVLATASMFLGNLTALLQSNIKRMMAYSSIAQVGYVLVGVVAAGSLQPGGVGTSAVLYYIMSYVLTNLGIFAILTHLDQEGGWVTVSDFNGLSQRNPAYAWALVIFFISLIGIPPTVGFMGKFFLFTSAVDTGYVWLAVVMAINSVISVGYYYRVVKAMFLEKSDRAPLQTSGPIMSAVVISVIGVMVMGTMLVNKAAGLTQAAAALLK